MIGSLFNFIGQLIVTLFFVVIGLACLLFFPVPTILFLIIMFAVWAGVSLAKR